jgi:8-oxo-dGTP pyrophosphatase MutT (NUDIX family)
MADFRRLAETEVHHGHIWRVVVADFEAPDGTRFERDVVRSPGAVAVVPVTFDGDGRAMVTLVRQYRPTFERELIEVPAGMRDVPGEPAEETGRRELAEEVGLQAGEMVLLTEMIPSPGMSDSVCAIYMATGCSRVERAVHGPEEQHSEVLELSLDEAVAMVVRGEITDAKSALGLLLAERHVHEQRP